ncbi:MtaA/CmuA family methyltransferase [Methanonatronarchaeum sp. AMET6-2]|uniref:MtaA/CmuA family methyltransferase n=1 Tax=Methanonatronarchaeum sp. AMET6-2 TaxID=2933293 RepID=UPI001FF24231|nr:MtaA/CmuA family methyltransferase [Methanonatronarchaeum sp. AMET6-2]UOY10261.1 MtaA/CmuA family methyltransferase [Methanonatronarchaeum sp. AMET6-2]
MSGEFGYRERFFRVLGGGSVDRVPCVMPLQTGVLDLMRLSGSFWPEAHWDPWFMSVLGMAGFRFAGVESVRLPFDMNVVCESLGCRLGFRGRDVQPVILENAISGLDEVEGVVPEVGGRMEVVGEAVRLVEGVVGDRVPVLAALSGPFYVAGQVRGMEDFLLEAYRGESGVHRLLEVCLEACSVYADYLVRCGADVVVVLGVSTDLISPEMYRELALPYQRRLVEDLRWSVLHVCGDTTPIFGDMARVGADGVSLDSVVSLSRFREVGGDCVVFGNVSPVESLLQGGPEDVARDSWRAVREGCDVLCSGCGLPPQTPVENLRAMVEVARNSGDRGF